MDFVSMATLLPSVMYIDCWAFAVIWSVEPQKVTLYIRVGSAVHVTDRPAPSATVVYVVASAIEPLATTTLPLAPLTMLGFGYVPPRSPPAGPAPIMPETSATLVICTATKAWPL